MGAATECSGRWAASRSEWNQNVLTFINVLGWVQIARGTLNWDRLISKMIANLEVVCSRVINECKPCSHVLIISLSNWMLNVYLLFARLRHPHSELETKTPLTLLEPEASKSRGLTNGANIVSF